MKAKPEKDAGQKTAARKSVLPAGLPALSARQLFSSRFFVGLR
jgi:hypothetical protein